MHYAARRELWERVWGSNRSGVPEYFTPEEYLLFLRLRNSLYDRYLGEIEEVSEFGCGTGHNLIPLIGTGRRLRGFDWSANAIEKVRSLGIEGEVFDMLKPDWKVKLSGAAVTIHALEQMGVDWGEFVNFLAAQKVLCLHIEPIEELYDENIPHDAACLAYHRKRGYLSGFLTRLQDMQKRGEAEILEVTKSPFGGMNHDAYSVVVWRPM